MKSLGQKLKERRMELGFSIEDIQNKTKLSPVHIKAIENGDIEYFKHDLSYLKFFVQYYCQAVYLDYNEVKGEVESIVSDFTQTQLLKIQESHEESNENIRKRINSNQKKYKRPINSQKMQYSILEGKTILLILASLLLIALLVFGFFKLVLPAMNSQNDQAQKPEITETKPQEEPESTQEPQSSPKPEPEPIEEEPVLETTEININNYSINQPATLKVVFTGDTWIEVYVNKQLVSDPGARVYTNGEEIEVPINATNKEVTINFGNLLGSTFYLDDQPFNLNQEIMAEGIPKIVTITLEGE